MKIFSNVFKSIILSFLLISCSGCAEQNEEALGLKLFNEKNFKTAKAHLEKASEEGSPKAQFYLGKMYLERLGVEWNVDKAVELFGKSADQGYAPAQTQLGISFISKNDITNAQKWLEKAANQNDSEAQSILGEMYVKEYLPGNPKKGVVWLEKAAAQNNPFAFYTLAKLYHTGHLVSKDTSKAFSLLQKAASLGIDRAQYRLGLFFCKGQGTKEDMVRGKDLFQKATQIAGDARDNWGIMNVNGEIIKQNPEQAFFWMQKAALQENANAQFCLALMYEEGFGVEKNYNRTKEELLKAYLNGVAEAHDYLNKMNEEGKITNMKEISPEFHKWYDKVILGNEETN